VTVRDPVAAAQLGRQRSGSASARGAECAGTVSRSATPRLVAKGRSALANPDLGVEGEGSVPVCERPRGIRPLDDLPRESKGTRLMPGVLDESVGSAETRGNEVLATIRTHASRYLILYQREDREAVGTIEGALSKGCHIDKTVGQPVADSSEHSVCEPEGRAGDVELKLVGPADLQLLRPSFRSAYHVEEDEPFVVDLVVRVGGEVRRSVSALRLHVGRQDVRLALAPDDLVAMGVEDVEASPKLIGEKPVGHDERAVVRDMAIVRALEATVATEAGALLDQAIAAVATPTGSRGRVVVGRVTGQQHEPVVR